MNTFLRPFIDECTLLEENGFIFNNDLFDCEHEGDTVTRDNGPPTRYYTYRDVLMRTSKNQATYALEAERTGQPVKGVKGIYVVQGLPTFDPVNRVTPEYMHSVCQGVMRQLSSLWLIERSMKD